MKGSILLACLAISFSSFAQEKVIVLKDQETYGITRDSLKDMISKKGILEFRSEVSDSTVQKIQNEAIEKTKKELNSEFSNMLKNELKKNTEQVSEQTRLAIKQDMKQEQAMRDQVYNELKNDRKLISLLKESLTEEITPGLKAECMKQAKAEYAASLTKNFPQNADVRDDDSLNEVLKHYTVILIPVRDIVIAPNDILMFDDSDFFTALEIYNFNKNIMRIKREKPIEFNELERTVSNVKFKFNSKDHHYNMEYFKKVLSDDFVITYKKKPIQDL